MQKSIPDIKSPKDLDSTLARQSKELFELDEECRHILSHIATHGHSTVYDIETKGNIARQSIYRRLNGEGQFPSLLDLQFVYLWKKEKFRRTGVTKKFYAVRLKGIIASLCEVKLDQVYAVHRLIDYISYLGAKDLIEPVKNLVKSETALMMQYHLENGLKLTGIRSDAYFQEFRHHLAHFQSESASSLFMDRYSGDLRGIRAEATRWVLIVGDLVDRLKLGKAELKRALLSTAFEWPKAIVTIQSTRNPECLTEILSSWHSHRYFYGMVEDEYSYARKQAKVFLERRR